jgi:hypothetical protein
MITPGDIQKLDDSKLNLEEIEKMIDESIMDFHGDNPWEEAVIKGEYSDAIMDRICTRYMAVGWRYIYWSRSSETGEKPGLTNIILSAKTPIDEKVTKNMHQIGLSMKKLLFD